MEKRDLLIIEYLSKGFKTTEISQKLLTMMEMQMFTVKREKLIKFK